MRRCTRCGKNRAARFYRGKRGRVCITCQKRTQSSNTKDRRLQETYSISHEEWQAILTSQGGVCAICNGKRPQYDTDHDHALERMGMPIRDCIRGLLCKRCNRRLLPAALDSIDLLLRAMDYLENGRQRVQAVLYGNA